METKLIEISPYIQVLSNIAFTISLFISLPYYLYNIKKERKRRVLQVYSHLMDEYMHILNVFLLNTNLDFYDDNLPILNDIESNRKRKIIFSMLIALFERAFVFFNSEDKWIREKYWQNWVGYMSEWVNRKSFHVNMQDAFKNDDSDFSSFLNSLIYNNASKF
jgi:hypothetical protein